MQCGDDFLHQTFNRNDAVVRRVAVPVFTIARSSEEMIMVYCPWLPTAMKLSAGIAAFTGRIPNREMTDVGTSRRLQQPASAVSSERFQRSKRRGEQLPPIHLRAGSALFLYGRENQLRSDQRASLQLHRE